MDHCEQSEAISWQQVRDCFATLTMAVLRP